MTTFIPVSAKLPKSFLSPVNFRAPLPARTEEKKAIIRCDVRLFRHMATEDCSEGAWLSLREIVGDTEKDSAFVCPRITELNLDKIFFRSYLGAAKYCGLFEVDLNHLHAADVVQNISVYRVGGSVSYSDTEIFPFGVLPLLS